MAESLCHAKQISSLVSTIFPSVPSLPHSNKSSLSVSKYLPPQRCSRKAHVAKSVGVGAPRLRSSGAIQASVSDSSPPASEERWLLEPVGDGDTRHIGFKVERPGPFEIQSSDLMVGRLPDKADMVIPVATVSGVHARIQREGGKLKVTDLDSTNGTFIDEKRLRPGVAATVSPGSLLTFGDTHLAIFRVWKLENTEKPEKEQEDPEAVMEGPDATS